MTTGLAVIMSGPSGAGKSTIIGKLNLLKQGLLFSVSCTTRAPRPGEIDGVHYHFIGKERFEELIAAGGFLEWANVHGNYYGTPKQPVIDAIDSGQIMLLDIDVQGARLIRKALAETPHAERLRTVFITVPSLEELEKRLRGRGTESPESLKKRLDDAAGEMACAGEYQYVIINDDADRAAGEMFKIISTL